MEIKPSHQGYLDSLCGIYSIVNADKIVNNSTEDESQSLFNTIIRHLAKKKILKDITLEGTDHKTMTDLINNVVGFRFPYKVSNRKSVSSLNEWWEISSKFLIEKPNRTIILSVGGRDNHLTVISRITQRRIFLLDSNKRDFFKRSDCTTLAKWDESKLVIYPAQCWYLGKE